MTDTAPIEERIRENIRARYPWAAKPELLYRALCAVLAEKTETIPWEEFSEQDWTHFEAMARGEQVAQLVYWAWKTERPSAAPSSLLPRLFAIFAQNQVRQQMLRKELSIRILPALQGIDPVVVLKGGALAQTLYPHPALRYMHDLDLLVPTVQQKEAVRRLGDLGYAVEVMYPGTAHQELGNRHHIQVISPSPESIPVEIHQVQALIRSLDETPDSLQLQWFWDQLVPLPLDTDKTAQAWMLSPAAQVLHLAVHLTLHHGEAEMYLIKYYDLHLLITRWGAQIDWDALLAQASATGRSAAVSAALEGCVSRLGTLLPEGYLDRLREGEPENILAHEVQRKSQMEFMKDIHEANATKFFFLLKKNPSWKAKARIALEMIFPSQAFIRWRYQPRPVWLWPLYYLVRWGQIVPYLLQWRRMQVKK